VLTFTPPIALISYTIPRVADLGGISMDEHSTLEVSEVSTTVGLFQLEPKDDSETVSLLL
jgi:hypothetical protein